MNALLEGKDVEVISFLSAEGRKLIGRYCLNEFKRRRSRRASSQESKATGGSTTGALTGGRRLSLDDLRGLGGKMELDLFESELLDSHHEVGRPQGIRSSVINASRGVERSQTILNILSERFHNIM